VADGDTVYITLGLREPLSALDAATGKVLREYEQSGATEEVLLRDNVLVLLVNKDDWETKDYGPKLNLGDQRRVAQEFHWNGQSRLVVAYEADSGKRLWKYETPLAPLTLASDEARVYFHDGEKVVCLDRETGERQWATIRIGRRLEVTMNFGPRLVVHDGIVLFAGGDRSMRAIESASGKIMWTAPHARGGYQSPEDLLVSAGLVWSTPTTSTRDSGVFTGRDLKTGEVKIEFPPDVETYWFHHRCYIAKATEKYLLPSRTGIEFVDFEKQNWDIHHWVRGGCLYGIMPCNGLVYAPLHNCACYPEAKLYGMNALAPASSNRQLAATISDADRLQRGPAYDDVRSDTASGQSTQWTTYRHDRQRSGVTPAHVSEKLKPTWQTQLDGRLSSVVVADGHLYVAEVDKHRLHALVAETGESAWTFTAGARIDSPPTVAGRRVLFGSVDGWVYCLRADDGAVAWRFRAAPRDERLVAFEQLESVWPVHGSVLVEDDVAYFVAGRSNFLDGGLRFISLNVATGEKLAETVIDDRDPETGEDIQDRLQILNMPVGLPDILSSDGRYLYMRSQRLDHNGFRHDLGPRSGNPAVQGSVQAGDTAHLFAPMGFLDDTWFHRAYWVYGRSFAGGHGGYYQAGKYAPSGRLLVSDEDMVYGFGRKPEYLRWTTTIEHQLFATCRKPPDEAQETAEEAVGRAADSSTHVDFGKLDELDPTKKPLAVSAWILADRPDGVVVAHGGPQNGYALIIRVGKPRFMVRAAGDLAAANADEEVVGKWTHLMGVLTSGKGVKLYVNGRLAAQQGDDKLVAANPHQGLQIGADLAGAVGQYNAPLGFTDIIDEVQVYHGAVGEGAAERLSEDPSAKLEDARLVLSCSFDGGRGTDASASGLEGRVQGAMAGKGQVGGGLRFTFRRSRGVGSFVQPAWTQDVPLLVRAMVKADETLFVAGPPDVIDEEETFQRLVSRDPNVAAKLAEQDAALDGKQGGRLRAVSARDGSTLAEYQLDSLPAWDALIATPGRLFFSTTDGKVVSYQETN
jgi:outer membrane protein assembly factor BamB